MCEYIVVVWSNLSSCCSTKVLTLVYLTFLFLVCCTWLLHMFPPLLVLFRADAGLVLERDRRWRPNGPSHCRRRVVRVRTPCSCPYNAFILLPATLSLCSLRHALLTVVLLCSGRSATILASPTSTCPTTVWINLTASLSVLLCRSALFSVSCVCNR